MNYKRVLRTVGGILIIEAVAMLAPIITALVYREYNRIIAYAIPAAAILLTGLLLSIIKPKNEGFYAKEGFLAVGLSWVIMSLFGAIPFVIGGEIKNYVDAVFETVSGFTTTGMTVALDVEAFSHAALMWRSVISFIGGMGILVFMLAILPDRSGSTMHIYRAETTGVKATKLATKMRFTARVLYLIYFTLTVILAAMLTAKMSIFDAICHAMTTASTCGFSTKNASIGAYNSVYVEMVIAAFMFLFSINFTLFYLILIGRAVEAFKNEELRVYSLIVLVSIIIISVSILRVPNIDGNYWTALRYSVFTAISVSSTTGFSSTNFYSFEGAIGNWPGIVVVVLLFLMIMGGMAGSTGGGNKASRIGIVSKVMLRDLKASVRPNKLMPVKFEGKALSEEEINSVKQHFLLYFTIIIISTIILSVFGTSFETNLTASMSAMGNIGPAFGKIGASGYVGALHPVAKITLILDMLLGRLEILPILALFVPSAWRFK